MHSENGNEKEEIRELKRALKSTHNKRMHIRYNVILLHLKHYTNQHIASIMDLESHTVARYINNYKQRGLEGLIMGKSTGCPRLLSTEQEKALYDVIATKTPDQVGFGERKNWNSAIACQWVKEQFNIEYSKRGMLDVLHRLGLSYTHPTYTLEKADPNKQELFKEEFKKLKKTDL